MLKNCCCEAIVIFTGSCCCIGRNTAFICFKWHFISTIVLPSCVLILCNVCLWVHIVWISVLTFNRSCVHIIIKRNDLVFIKKRGKTQHSLITCNYTVLSTISPMFQTEVTQLLDWATCVIINSNAIYADVKYYNNYFVTFTAWLEGFC